MKLKHSLLMAGLAAAMCLSAESVLAQGDGGGRRQGGGGGAGGGPGGGFGGRGNFDPAEFQRMRTERLREAMAVTDDAEWKVIEDRITKVNDANMAVMAATANQFGRGRRGGGGGAGGGGGFGGGAGGRGGAFGQPMPELESLRNAIDNNAPEAQVKAALQRYREARKAREDALAKAQAELQKVLTPKQEAVAVTEGLLK